MHCLFTFRLQSIYIILLEFQVSQSKYSKTMQQGRGGFENKVCILLTQEDVYIYHERLFTFLLWYINFFLLEFFCEKKFVFIEMHFLGKK